MKMVMHVMMMMTMMVSVSFIKNMLFVFHVIENYVGIHNAWKSRSLLHDNFAILYIVQYVGS